MTKRFVPYLLMFLALLLIDTSSKWWVHTNLPLIQNASVAYPYGGLGIFSNFFGIEFSIVNVINRGAAWGSFSNAFTALLVIRIAVSVMLAAYLLFCKRPAYTSLPLLLILFGAVGNVIDCFTYGFVIDMLHFKFWGWSYPVFNLADAAICIGAFWLALQSWRHRERIEVA